MAANVPDAPEGLAAALTELGAEVERWWRAGARRYAVLRGPGGEPWFARFSTDPADEARLAFEEAARATVPGTGRLRSPAVLRRGPGWMVEEAVRGEPLRGEAVMRAVAEATFEVAELDLPEPPPPEGRGGFLRTLARRAAVAVGPVGRDVVRSRRLAASVRLPVRPAHRDLHAGNLFVRQGLVWVIDWEVAGPAPLGADAMRVWCSLGDAADREALFESVVTVLGEPHRADLAALRYAAAVEMLHGAVANRRPSERDPELARRLTRLLPSLRPG